MFVLENLVKSKWMTLGLRVGLVMDQLESWEEEFRGNTTRCWRRVMKHWLDSGGAPHYPDTWEGLSDLLRDCDLAEVATLLLKALEHCVM